MPERVHEDVVATENGNFSRINENVVVTENGNPSHIIENVVAAENENGISSRINKNSGEIKAVIDTSIEQLFENVCDMQSSDQSPSRASFGSDGEESIIDSELRHLVGGARREVEIMEEEERVEEREEAEKLRNGYLSDSPSNKKSSSAEKKSGKFEISLSSSKSKKTSGSDESGNSNRKSNASILDKKNEKSIKKASVGGSSSKKVKNSSLGGIKSQNGTDDSSDSALNNPDLGPFLLKQARNLLSSGENSPKALELAHRATKSFENCSKGKPNLDLVMSLHVTAAIYCNLGKYNEAIAALERSLEILSVEENPEHALAKFSGYMQLGDTYALVGQVEKSIFSYTSGLEIQIKILGDTDVRVGETCRYLAEAHIQALQFENAFKYCQMALDIHRNNGSHASLEEAADRRLMGLICENKGDHEGALEHLVLAGMNLVANGQEMEVAFVDVSIGDTYLSLNRYDEAVFAFQKALTVFKFSKGDSHPTVASVFVRLADLYNKTGKLRESKSYCENALRIYMKPILGFPQEEIASGLTDVAAIFESMNELEQAIKLLQKSLKIYNDYPGHQNTIAGIEAQMGVIYYMLGNYSESYSSLKNAVSKLRASGEKKSAFFGIALNQMGLACVQRYDINEAAKLFEEARGILEQENGPYHPDTLGVYSNLAGTYDALGRLDEAIEVLEHVVGMREEKLGTANPDVDDEKKRLAVLLKETGKVRTKKARSLENLLDANHNTQSNGGIKV